MDITSSTSVEIGIIAFLAAFCICAFIFYFKGTIDYSNTISERRGEESRSSLLGWIVFLVIAAVVIYAVTPH